MGDPNSTENQLKRPATVQLSSSDDSFQKEKLSLKAAEETAENMEEVVNKAQKSYLAVSILCLLVAFGGFIFGWDTGTISGFVGMSDFKKRFGQVNIEGNYYLSNVRTGLLVSIFNIGAAGGGLTLGKLGDIYGRKKGLMITMLVYIVGVTIQIAASKSWVQYFIGRILAGLAVGSVSVLCPLFISETSPKQTRGTMVSCYQLMMTGGIFLGYCTTYGTYHNYSDSRQWRIPLGLGYVWAILMIIGMFFMAESPRYLLEKNNIDQARSSLSKIYGVPIDSSIVSEELDLINSSVGPSKAQTESAWNTLIYGRPKILYRVFVGAMLQALQQLTGVNYFFYYCSTLFSSVGLDDSYQTSIIIGLVNFLSTLLALYTADRFGRRKSLITGSIAMGVCMLIFACIGTQALYPGEYGINPNKGAGSAMIVFTCLFIFFFATTWGPIVWVIISETYPMRIKAVGSSIATSSNWMWNFLIAFFTPFITDAIHFAYGFVFFGCIVFSGFFVFAFVPETKGLSLEDVDALYANYTPGLAFLNKNKPIQHDEEAHQEEKA